MPHACMFCRPHNMTSCQLNICCQVPEQRDHTKCKRMVRSLHEHARSLPACGDHAKNAAASWFCRTRLGGLLFVTIRGAGAACESPKVIPAPSRPTPLRSLPAAPPPSSPCSTYATTSGCNVPLETIEPPVFGIFTPQSRQPGCIG